MERAARCCYINEINITKRDSKKTGAINLENKSNMNRKIQSLVKPNYNKTALVLCRSRTSEHTEWNHFSSVELRPPPVTAESN